MRTGQRAYAAVVPRPQTRPRQAGAGHTAPAVDLGTGAAGLAARAAGLTLGELARVTAELRDGRPLHPQGATFDVTTVMHGGQRTGVPWLDEPAVQEGSARVSRAIGLPKRLPDIYGVALRLHPGDGAAADLLFASTGTSALGRLNLRLRSSVGSGALTTLLPLRAPCGPLLLRVHAPVPALVPEGELPPTMAISYAVGRGPWVRAGELRAGGRHSGTTDAERHDPVVHQLPGTSQYEVVRRLREPAYRAARRVPAQ